MWKLPITEHEMVNMNKRVVFYDPSAETFILLGSSAYVFPINHDSPLVSNTKHVLTSEVISVDPGTGEFETLNTIYKPCEGAEKLAEEAILKAMRLYAT